MAMEVRPLMRAISSSRLRKSMMTSGWSKPQQCFERDGLEL
jgi:hypothetical protein